jgi:phosphoserine aminotransferase
MEYFFTPGPSELYYTVSGHMQQALKQHVGSISHRSKSFEAIFEKAVTNVRTIMGVPDHFHVVFTGSATEVWERLLQNCVEKETTHLVNGSFSKRFYQFSQELGLKANKIEAELGQGFYTRNLPEVSQETEAICVTHNETSTGVFYTVEEINKLSDQYPDKLIFVDSVSSVPYPSFDFDKIDSVFFSVQKGMGLPAGLGVWIFNEKCVAKSNAKLSKGLSLGTYHTIPSLLEKATKNQTPETPNVLGIYLLGAVTQDMLDKGIEKIRLETERKAAALYNLFEQHPHLSPSVIDENLRSKTVCVGKVLKGSAQDLIQLIKEKSGYIVGSGYGPNKSSEIRIANFPTHSLEHTYQLIDVINQYYK